MPHHVSAIAALTMKREAHRAGIMNAYPEDLAGSSSTMVIPGLRLPLLCEALGLGEMGAEIILPGTKRTSISASAPEFIRNLR